MITTATDGMLFAFNYYYLRSTFTHFSFVARFRNVSFGPSPRPTSVTTEILWQYIIRDSWFNISGIRREYICFDGCWFSFIPAERSIMIYVKLQCRGSFRTTLIIYNKLINKNIMIITINNINNMFYNSPNIITIYIVRYYFTSRSCLKYILKMSSICC